MAAVHTAMWVVGPLRLHDAGVRKVVQSMAVRIHLIVGPSIGTITNSLSCKWNSDVSAYIRFVGPLNYTMLVPARSFNGRLHSFDRTSTGTKSQLLVLQVEFRRIGLHPRPRNLRRNFNESTSHTLITFT
jgi:hypothetical protein